MGNNSEADGSLFALTTGQTAVENSAEEAPQRSPLGALLWPVVSGAMAAVLLAVLYIAVAAVAQDAEHAVSLLTGDWYLTVPIVVGFGVQVGLFVHLRAVPHRSKVAGSAKALLGAGTGTSSVSMLACCAHHLADLLPIVGLSGVALFLGQYREPLLALSIGANAIGIAVMLRLIRRAS